MKHTLSLLALLPVALQAADPPKEVTNSIGMKLVQIPAGQFVMGTDDGPPTSLDLWASRHDESPAQTVKISRPF